MMHQNSKLIDYAAGVNSRLDFICKKKIKETQHCHNNTISKLKKSMFEIQKTLQVIHICPSNEHRLSIKYLGRSNTAGNTTNHDRATSQIHQDLPTLKYFNNNNNSQEPPVPKIIATINGQQITLEKSFSYRAQPTVKPLPTIHHLRSKTTLENENPQNETPKPSTARPNNFSPRHKHYLTGINNRMKKFIDRIESGKENNIDVRDFTETENYKNSLFLSKTDFDWKMKYLYISRRQTKADNNDDL